METTGQRTTNTGGRRRADVLGTAVADTRDQLRAALTAPLRRPAPVRAVVVGALVLALLEGVGLGTRLACAQATCGGVVARLDMDAIGSVPRLAITALLLATGLASAVGIVTASRHGARPWWSILAATGLALAAAKAWSVHSVVERSLGTVLPAVDVQLLFVVVSLVGLTVAAISGIAVRRDTRWATLTWLALYAVAAVGLAEVTNLVHPAGPVPAAVATFVEETGEAWTALGLLVVQVVGVRSLRARRDRVAVAEGDVTPYEGDGTASRRPPGSVLPAPLRTRDGGCGQGLSHTGPAR